MRNLSPESGNAERGEILSVFSIITLQDGSEEGRVLIVYMYNNQHDSYKLDPKPLYEVA